MIFNNLELAFNEPSKLNMVVRPLHVVPCKTDLVRKQNIPDYTILPVDRNNHALSVKPSFRFKIN